MSTSKDAPLVSTRWVEIALALFTAALGGIVMYGSLEIGIGWSDSGPQAGYFPFYIGLLLSSASLGNLLMVVLRWELLATAFVARKAFAQVLAVFVPITAYVILHSLIGIYLASAAFIAWFMWRNCQGTQRHGLPIILAISIGAPLASYLIFAVWFKVPLDAGVLTELPAILKRVLS